MKIPKSSTPSISPLCANFYESTELCTPVNINITFDDYPGETSWDIHKLIPLGDDIMVKCHSNTDIPTPPTDICLEGGRYSFTIRDRAGDGLCCGSGREGSYKIFVNGEVVAQGGQFGKAETKLFSIRDPTCHHQVEVDVEFDRYPQETSWDIQKVGMTGVSTLITGYNATRGETTYTGSVCLQEEGQYRFTVYDTDGDGMGSEPEKAGQYIVAMDGQVIAKGSVFKFSESTLFDIRGPTSAPSQSTTIDPTQSPTASKAPTIRATTSTPTVFCEWVAVNIAFDRYSKEISWGLHGIGDSSGEDATVVEYGAGERSATQSICLQKGFYKFTINDSIGDGLGDGQYNVMSISSENGMAMVIAQGGNFGFKEATEFSIPFQG